MADDPNPYSLWAPQTLNQTRGRLRKRTAAYEIGGLDSLKLAASKTFASSRIPPNGPYVGQVIWSYGPDQPPPPGHIYDYIEGQDSALIRFPWVVARIEELMSNIPNPAKYDPNGTPRQRFLYWKAVKAHFQVGICFPEVEDPQYPQPNPGDRVLVSYTNAKTFSGARFKVLSFGNGVVVINGEFGEPGRRLQMVLDEDGNWVPVDMGEITPPNQTESLSEYLQRQGVSIRMADNIMEDANDPPREKWHNVVPAAMILMALEARTGFRLRVISSYRRSTRRQGRNRHLDFHALDVDAYYEGTNEPVSDEDWIRTQRIAINLWKTQGRELNFGLGVYIKEWGNERQIHVDGDGYRRWAHGPDAGAHPITGEPTRGMTLEEYFRNFGDGYDEERVLSLNPEYDSIKELLKDAFWRLIEEGVPTESDFRRIFSGTPGLLEASPIPNLSNLYLR